MEEVAYELRGIREAQKETIEAQKQRFQVELKKVIKELEKVKLSLTALEIEIEIVKAQKLAQKQNYFLEKLEAKKVAMTKSSRSDKMVEIRDFQSTESPHVDVDTTPISSSLGMHARI